MTSVPQTKPPPGFVRWYCPYGSHLQGPNPDQYMFVELWREGHTATCVVDPKKLSPIMNVVGLYWRPVKGMSEEEH